MRRAAIAALVLGLAGCNPPPRAASYFKAHPEEAQQVVADCATGAHRGPECENAKAAEAQIQSDARLKLYRKTF